MCDAVLKRLLLLVIIGAVRGVSSPKSIFFPAIKCGMECRLPQEKSLILARELQIDREAETVPYMITLHRCDVGTGCCKTKNQTCKVAKVEIINATIYVKFYNSIQYELRSYEILDHTECSCQESSDTPK